MNPRRLFVASCIALIASAFSFVTRGDILPALGQTFNLSQTSRGSILGSAFWGMAAAMFVGSFIVDALGMKRMLGLAFLGHLVGSVMTIGSPYFVDPANTNAAYNVLWYATFLIGCANGFVEIGINPLAATLYPTEKTHRLNILHAWWPGGLMLGGLICYAIDQAMGLTAVGVTPGTVKLGWQIKSGLILVPTVIYGVLFLLEPFPVTERVASGVSTGEMFAQIFRPMFLLWAFCMLLTSSTELGPQSWQNSVLPLTAGVNGTLIVVYTSSLMFVMRHFAGPIAHRLSPVGMLTGSAILSAIGLYLLSFATTPITAIGAATVYGLGIIYFWPTMLGVTAERFPRGGPFLMGLMGCVGNLAIAATSPMIGGIFDVQTLKNLPANVRDRVVVERTQEPLEKVITGVLPADARAAIVAPSKVDLAKVASLPTPEEKQQVTQALAEGAKSSFRAVSVLPMILIVIFGGIAISDRLRGGYKPEELPAAVPATDY